MGKTVKTLTDPYENVRRDIPKPGHVIRHKKEYLKPLERRKTEMEIREGVEEYFEEVDDAPYILRGL